MKPCCLLLLLLSACDSGSVAAKGEHGDASAQVAFSSELSLERCGFAEAAPAQITVAEELDSFHSSQTASIEARVADAPPLLFHEVTLEAGSCRYLRASKGGCEPVCEQGELCDAKRECRSLPRGVSGGTLELLGLEEPLELDAVAYDPGIYFGPNDLPKDLFDENAIIGARMSSDELGEVVLGARGVQAMDSELLDTGLELVSGEDAMVQWEPGPDEDVCVRLVLNGSNTAHGAPLEDIIEVFPTGETPELTEGFDWPYSTLTRYSRSRSDTKLGDAELLVRSRTYFRIHHQP